MPARQCNLDNRPNKTDCHFNATAFGALTQFARTPQRIDRKTATLERRTPIDRSGHAGSHSSISREQKYSESVV